MVKNAFFKKLSVCKEEREVEDVYVEGISFYYKNASIEHPFKCDGLVETTTDAGKMLKLILEYKFDYDFTNRAERAKVIVQVLYYLKKFEQDGAVIPNVCLIGDVNECFVFHTNDIIKYLDFDTDWSIAPSQAHLYNAEMILAISEDANINPFVFEIHNDFDFKVVIDKINTLADNVQRYVHVTEHNISNIFDYFCSRVIDNKSKKIGAKDLVAIFMGVITDHENYYKHPVKKNTLCTPMGEYKLKKGEFDAFFSYFNREYTPQEKNNFSGIADRLIEDTNRRASGDFWTPTAWVDFAHKRIAETFGENWKDEYVVWDNCCGSKNLTRDYKFKELYCSTLEASELEIGKRYNPEAVSFQFDFLNDFIPNGNELFAGECKLPKGLLEALKQNKKIMFLINPPYARNNGGGIKGGTETSVSETLVGSQMTNDKYGSCSANLYAQFFYRIEMIKKQYGLTNCVIAIFCPTLFLSGSSYKQFRSFFLNDFEYMNGFQFQASHFADVASNWGIGFTIWNSGITNNKIDFNLDICDIVNNKVKIIKNKCIYNIDKYIKASDWCISCNKNELVECVPMTSSIKIGSNDVKLDKNSFAGLVNQSNNVEKNAQFVTILNSRFNHKGTKVISILEDNFTRCTALFSARKLITCNWINSKDEYLAPNESHPQFNEFVNDSIVYSLFHSGSNQSSLRQVEYKGKLWDIKNEFFWMSNAEIQQLANENDNDSCYNDAHSSADRYVYTLLQSVTLSAEAQAVLDKANELVRKSFKFRKLWGESHPEYQINNWDCGYYQLKEMWKEYFRNDFDEFRNLYNALADKMRPMVYELGFLK